MTDSIYAEDINAIKAALKTAFGSYDGDVSFVPLGTNTAFAHFRVPIPSLDNAQRERLVELINTKVGDVGLGIVGVCDQFIDQKTGTIFIKRLVPKEEDRNTGAWRDKDRVIAAIIGLQTEINKMKTGSPFTSEQVEVLAQLANGILAQRRTGTGQPEDFLRNILEGGPKPPAARGNDGSLNVWY